MGLKIVIMICLFAIMAIGGIYAYKYLNNKLTSSKTTFALIFYALLLFVAMGSIYGGGLFAMAWLFDYLSI